MKFNSEIKPVEQADKFNMDVQREVILRSAPTEVITKLVNTIDLTNQVSLVTFGKDAAEEISKCSDTILRNMEMSKVDQAGGMLTSLAKIMDRFDPKELAPAPTNFFAKLFFDAKKNIEGILSKYNTIGSEVDKIYVELKSYEGEINTSNSHLEKLFESNLSFYTMLNNYILAGDEAVRLIREEKDRLQQELTTSTDNTLQFKLQNVDQGLQILEQRVHDLRMAENVAMQSIPMIKAMQFSNVNLVRKINSAFIITLPIFKQGLTQAIMLKRQRIQADALSALDQRTNEMLLKNAHNTVEQTKMIAQLAGSSSIKIETLEQTFATIVSGIDEVQKIQSDASKRREDDKKRLEKIKQEYSSKIFVTGK